PVSWEGRSCGRGSFLPVDDGWPEADPTGPAPTCSTAILPGVLMPEKNQFSTNRYAGCYASADSLQRRPAAGRDRHCAVTSYMFVELCDVSSDHTPDDYC